VNGFSPFGDAEFSRDLDNLPAERLTPQQAAQVLLCRRRARERLLAFACYVGYGIPLTVAGDAGAPQTGREFAIAEHHALMAEELEAMRQGASSGRLLINTPPRCGKSLLVSGLFPAWLIGNDPTLRIAVCGYSEDFSRNVLAQQFAQIVECEEYRRLFGDVFADDSKSMVEWRTKRGGSISFLGVGSAMTGRTLQVVILDDLIKGSETSASPALLESVWAWFLTGVMSREQGKLDVICISTRWDTEDPTGRILHNMEKGGPSWRHLSFPAVDDHGDPRWPHSKEFLAAQKALWGSRLYSCLYLCDPSEIAGHHIRIAWLDDNQYSAGDLFAPADRQIYLGVDLASTPDDGDYTVFAAMSAQWNPLRELVEYYVLDIYRQQVSSSDGHAALLQTVRRLNAGNATPFPVRAVFIEDDNQSRERIPLIRNMLRPFHCRVLEVPRSAHKLDKAQGLIAHLENGQVFFDQMGPWYHVLRSEVAHWMPEEVSSRTRHDDQIDALANIIRGIYDKRYSILASIRRAPPSRRNPDGSVGFDGRRQYAIETTKDGVMQINMGLDQLFRDREAKLRGGYYWDH